MVAGKSVVVGLSAVSLVTLLSGLGYHFKPYFSGEDDVELSDAEAGQGAIAGRIVAIPAEMYRDEFGTEHMLKLGDCPKKKDKDRTVDCGYQFKGNTVFIPKGKTTVDVTRVQTTEDILNHVMGGVGVTVGALGIISVTPKVKVAVTTKTNSKTLNLISSYEVNLGAETLSRPYVYKSGTEDSALYLSEIEYGGNEVLLVTLEFESEDKKTDVEVSVTFKILFISITAKVRYVKTNSKSEVSCRVQLKSSWRDEEDVNVGNDMERCVKEVKRLEDKFKAGPSELLGKKDRLQQETKLHYFYYFASWQQSPYGKEANQALINHDLAVLTDQLAELKAVIERIDNLPAPPRTVTDLQEALSQKEKELTEGLRTYHSMSVTQKETLRKVYGRGVLDDQMRPITIAPQYYTRKLARLLQRV